MEELNEIKNQFDELMAKAEEIVKKNEEGDEKEDKRWRAEERGMYWYVSPGFEALNNIEVLSGIDSRRWETCNYFKTEEEAHRVAQHFKDYLILRTDAKGFESKDIHCEDGCFYVFWNCYLSKLEIIYGTSYRRGVICFENEEDAQASVEKHGDIWKRYLGVEE